MVSFKTQNHTREEKSGFTVEGIKLVDAFENVASAHKQSPNHGNKIHLLLLGHRSGPQAWYLQVICLLFMPLGFGEDNWH